MVLSDVDIKRYIALGKIKIAPELPPEQFGSCSVDFRLGCEFSVFEHSRHSYIDLKDRTAIQDLMRTIRVGPGEPFTAHSREAQSLLFFAPHWPRRKPRWFCATVRS